MNNDIFKIIKKDKEKYKIIRYNALKGPYTQETPSVLFLLCSKKFGYVA